MRGFPSEGVKGEAAHGVALPPRAAGGFYLGLAPATAGDRDGTRADADGAMALTSVLALTAVEEPVQNAGTKT